MGQDPIPQSFKLSAKAPVLCGWFNIESFVYSLVLALTRITLCEYLFMFCFLNHSLSLEIFVKLYSLVDKLKMSFCLINLFVFNLIFPVFILFALINCF